MNKPIGAKGPAPQLPPKLTGLLSGILRYMEQAEHHMKGEIK